MHGTTTTEERNAMTATLDKLRVDEAEALYQRNAQLEADMIGEGVDQYRAAVEKAKKRGQVSHLGPFRTMTETLITPVAKALDAWKVSKSTLFGSAVPRALGYLKDFPSDVAALIMVREMLDRIDPEAGNRKLMAICASVGMRVQVESRMRAWKEYDPKLWGAVQHGLDEQGATAVHRGRVNINRFNVTMRDELGWKDWPKRDVLLVGLAMVEQLVVGTGGRFKIEQDINATKSNPKHASPLVLVMDEETRDKLLASTDTEAYRHPVYMPTIIKPLPWKTMRDGGYHTEALRRRTMVRFKAGNEEVQSTATRELGHVDMPHVYDALNTIQEVPWQINHRVYDVAKRVWDKDLALAGMPSKKLLDVAALVPVLADDATPAQRKHWAGLRTDLYKRNATMPGKVLKAQRTLDIATTYLNETMYFPHFLDFRGRMYPLPADLQPQGMDLARGLLTFAQGKPMDAAAGEWLAVHLANVWGHDKLPFADRIAWVLKSEDKLRRIASDPLKNRGWCKAGDPWQSLAACFEWVRWLDEGVGMVSSLPIRVDGTCNGIQHLAALVRDPRAGASVNLTPDTKPHDIYREVAVLLEARFRQLLEDRGEKGLLAGRWLEACKGTFPRTLTKRPVMIFPYGGTREAYRKYTAEWMDEIDPTAQLFPWDGRRDMLNLMVDEMWEAISEKLAGPRALQQWLQKCARLACSAKGEEGHGLPLNWTTPCGFVVRHFYAKRKYHEIDTFIDGQRVRLVDWELTADLDADDQTRGIPPNFVHSMDASVLMTTINMAYNAGIDSLTCIHDAYGTVAADVAMLNACLRKSFVWTYEQPVLKRFRDACLDILDDDLVHASAMPPLPRMGSLDIEHVLDSDYFFA